MRFQTVIACLSLAVVPGLALAEQLPGEVGALNAVYDFCAKVDSAQRADFERHADLLFKGLSPSKVAALRASPEYQRGYQALSGILPNLKGADALKACQAISGGQHEDR